LLGSGRLLRLSDLLLRSSLCRRFGRRLLLGDEYPDLAFHLAERGILLILGLRGLLLGTAGRVCGIGRLRLLLLQCRLLVVERALRGAQVGDDRRDVARGQLLILLLDLVLVLIRDEQWVDCGRLARAHVGK
jgi:hypothetical protein